MIYHLLHQDSSGGNFFCNKNHTPDLSYCHIFCAFFYTKLVTSFSILYGRFTPKLDYKYGYISLTVCFDEKKKLSNLGHSLRGFTSLAPAFCPIAFWSWLSISESDSFDEFPFSRASSITCDLLGARTSFCHFGTSVSFLSRIEC